MKSPRTAGFENLTVVSFENRKGKEIATLIANQHGIPLVAPAMREIPLEQNPAAFTFAEELLAGRLNAVIFMTGVGARTLMEVLTMRPPTALPNCSAERNRYAGITTHLINASSPRSRILAVSLLWFNFRIARNSGATLRGHRPSGEMRKWLAGADGWRTTSLLRVAD